MADRDTELATGKQVVYVYAVADAEKADLKNIIIGTGCTMKALPSFQDLCATVKEHPSGVIVIGGPLQQEMRMDLLTSIAMRDDGRQQVTLLVVTDRSDVEEWGEHNDFALDFAVRPVCRQELRARIGNLLRLSSCMEETAHFRAKMQTAQKFECLGMLASGVAHEINNLMCVILGYADMAQQDGGQNVEMLKESAGISLDTAKRASSIATGLLSLSRHAASQKTLDDLNEVIRGALRLMRRTLERDSVEVVTEFGDLPKTMLASGPIQQVFLNLVLNAVQAMENRQTKRLTITTVCKDGNKIETTVEDTGAGVSKENMERLFQPFFTTKQSGESGTGLGLTVVREMVRGHGGRVTVESDEGSGTRFTVCLPVTVSDDSCDDSSSEATETARSARQKHILILDDEESNRRLLTRILLRYGHRPYPVSTPAEAMNALWAQPMDLIVLDLIMPQMNGKDVIHNLRDAGIDVPVLLCTGHSDRVMIEEALSAGARGVVMKPFTARDLTTAIDRCFIDS